MRYSLVLFAALASFASAAQAGSGYLTLKGEYNASAESEVTTSTFTGGANDGVGYGAGVAFGNQLSPYLRAEVEVDYRKMDFDTVVGGSAASGSIPDTLETYSGFGNLYIDFRNSTSIIPYIGGGAGIVYDKDTEAHALGFQGMAGLDLRVGGGLTFFAGYKYLQTEDFERTSDSPLGPIPQDYNIKAHIAEGGMRFLF